MMEIEHLACIRNPDTTVNRSEYQLNSSLNRPEYQRSDSVSSTEYKLSNSVSTKDFHSISKSIFSEDYALIANSKKDYSKLSSNINKMVVDTQVSDVQPVSPDTVSQKADDFYRQTEMETSSEAQMTDSFAQAKQMIEAFAQASRMNNNVPGGIQMAFPSMNFPSHSQHELVSQSQVSPRYVQSADSTQDHEDYSSSGASTPSPKGMLAEHDGNSSPCSGVNGEDRRSRRKPTLEDIVRRMREPEQSFSESEGEEEQVNGGLTIDMERNHDEVDGQHIPKNIPFPPNNNLETIDKSNNGDKNDVHSPEAKPVPSDLKGEDSLSPKTPVTSNGILPDQIMKPGYMTPQMNGWMPTPFNGLPMFPFSPHPIEQNLAAKLFPNVENKFPSPPDVEKDYLKCQFCERTFRRQKNLENHIENTHQGKGMVRKKPEPGSGDMYFKCTHCPYTTKHQSNLYVHLRIHTGERPYICGACGVQYSQSHSLKSHIINKHDGIMSYYIKEKRNRSPRGMSYITTHVASENSPLRMSHHAALLNLHLQQQQQQQQLHHHLEQQQLHHQQLQSALDTPLRSNLPSMESFKAPLEQMRSPAYQPSQSSPQFPLNGHVSPHLLNASMGHANSPGSASGLSKSQDSLPPKSEPADDSCGAIDLSKKSRELPKKADFHDQLSPLQPINSCGSCKASFKLKLLRLNVIRMLSILVPNLNFEDKGISADSDNVDDLLQDVIESNMQEEDMAE